MDQAQKNTKTLLERVQVLTQGGLLRHYIRICTLANNEKTVLDNDGEIADVHNVGRNEKAIDMVGMEVETSQMIRSAERILALTRELKELWLFGKLDTLTRGAETEQKTEEDALAVAQLLDEFRRKRFDAAEDESNDL